MQIRRVQSNQTTFGTKVYLESSTKELILKSKAKRKFLNHINKLENNGVDDVFVLKHSSDSFFKDIKWLRGVVYEQRKSGIYKTPWGSEDSLVFENMDGFRRKYASILKLYDEAKNAWTMRKTDEEFYKMYISKLQTI